MANLVEWTAILALQATRMVRRARARQ